MRAAAALGRRWLSLVAIAADARTVVGLTRLALARALGWGESGPPVRLRLKPLRSLPVFARPRTSDLDVLAEDLLEGFPLPPDELAGRTLSTIVELGSNVGIGLCALAAAHPEAELMGVEADPENVALARANTAALGGRCRVEEAAVWDRDAEVVVDRAVGRATGFTVRERRGDDPVGLLGVRAVAVTSLLAGFRPGEPIDYLYLDIEGAHARLLTGDAAWLGRVQAIKVAGHHDTEYGETQCADDLRRLGFRARVVPFGATGWTVGIR